MALLVGLIMLWLFDASFAVITCHRNILDIGSSVMCQVRLPADTLVRDIEWENISGLKHVIVPFPSTFLFRANSTYNIVISAGTKPLSQTLSVTMKPKSLSPSSVQISVKDFVDCDDPAQTAVRPCSDGSAELTGRCSCTAQAGACQPGGYCAFSCDGPQPVILKDGLVSSTASRDCIPIILQVDSQQAQLYGPHRPASYVYSANTEGTLTLHDDFEATGGDSGVLPSVIYTHALVSSRSSDTVKFDAELLLAPAAHWIKVGGSTLYTKNVTLQTESITSIVGSSPSAALPRFDKDSCIYLHRNAKLYMINGQSNGACTLPSCMDVAVGAEVVYSQCRNVDLQSSWTGAGTVSVTDWSWDEKFKSDGQVRCSAEETKPLQVPVKVIRHTINLHPLNKAQTVCGQCGTLTMRDARLLVTTLCVPTARFFGDLEIQGNHNLLTITEVNVGANPIAIDGELKAVGTLDVQISLSSGVTPNIGDVYPLFRAARGIVRPENIQSWPLALVGSAASQARGVLVWQVDLSTVKAVYTDSTTPNFPSSMNGIMTITNLSPSRVTCGNGLKELGEQCDDGNNRPGDGCASSCDIESGYSCTGLTNFVSVCVFTGGDDDDVSLLSSPSVAPTVVMDDDTSAGNIGTDDTTMINEDNMDSNSADDDFMGGLTSSDGEEEKKTSKGTLVFTVSAVTVLILCVVGIACYKCIPSSEPLQQRADRQEAAQQKQAPKGSDAPVPYSYSLYDDPYPYQTPYDADPYGYGV